ncbi:hypothetical protein MXB_1825 [Myxobolus squamalis]
MVLFV